ncbi:MAG TPA: hypothetical protein VI056_07070 [Candidatus Limnocylindria bacterium]
MGMRITMGVQPGGGVPFWFLQILSGTGTVVMVLNAVLVGVIVALATLRIEGAASAILAVGALGFVVALLLQGLYVRRNIAKMQAGLRPRFPTPPGDR